MKLIETQILKSRSGVYQDNSKNRRLHRVGQKYGAEKQPEDGEKTEEKETDPAKELEAVNKVIAAINEGKMNLPAAEVMKLSEKKQKLEAAKKQAEKINAGVKANEEKRNAKEIKETNKKINEAAKQKKYGDMNVEEAKKELLGKDLTITDIETGKTRTEKITSILEGNVRGHETVMARVEGGGTYPIKHINTGKEWKAWKLNLNSSSKETKSEPKKEDGDGFEEANKEAKPTETSENNEERQKIANRVEKVFAKVAADENVEQTLLREYVKNKIKDSAFDTEILTSKVKDNLNKMIGHLNETKEGKEVLKELKKFKGSKQLSSKKEKQVSSLKEDLDHHNNELDNLENKKEDYIKQHGEEKYNERHKKIEDKIEDTRKELDNLKGSDKTGGNEEKETYTRVKFDDLPNSGRVNLKKYLSDKVKKTADQNLGVLSKVSTDNLKKMEAGLVREFNSQFDDLPKSRRAEKLYSIMKVKAELENRSKRQFDEFKTHTESLDDNALLAEGYQIGEEARKIHNRGFKNFEEQHEAQKVLKELEMKRQINENEQNRRMKLLDEKK